MSHLGKPLAQGSSIKRKTGHGTLSRWTKTRWEGWVQAWTGSAMREDLKFTEKGFSLTILGSYSCSCRFWRSLTFNQVGKRVLLAKSIPRRKYNFMWNTKPWACSSFVLQLERSLSHPIKQSCFSDSGLTDLIRNKHHYNRAGHIRSLVGMFLLSLTYGLIELVSFPRTVPHISKKF